MTRQSLILISGVACDDALWACQTASLQDVAAMRCVTPDRETIEANAADILASAPDRFAVAGHSMGGYVALAVQRAAPERVERLALIGSGASVEQPDQNAARMTLIGLVRERGYDAMLAKLVPAMAGSDARADPEMMRGLDAMVRRAGAERFIRQQLCVAGRPDPMPALSRVTVPMIAIAGAQDRIIPPEQGAAAAAAVRGARFTLLEGCGHIAPVEKAGIVTDLLRAWLSADPAP